MAIAKLERLKALVAADPSNTLARYSLAMEQKKTDPGAALHMFAALRVDHPKYVPAYYHYAKTLEETGDTGAAAEVYRAGMEVARAAGDTHAYGELEAALDLL